MRAQVCPTFCYPMDHTPPGSSAKRLCQQEYWSRLSFPILGDLLHPGIVPVSFVSATLASEVFTAEPPKLVSEWVKVAQSCPTLCNPVDYTVLGILQARILEWETFPFSSRSSQPRDQTQVSRIAGGFFTGWAIREAEPPGKSQYCLVLNLKSGSLLK